MFLFPPPVAVIVGSSVYVHSCSYVVQHVLLSLIMEMSGKCNAGRV